MQAKAIYLFFGSPKQAQTKVSSNEYKKIVLKVHKSEDSKQITSHLVCVFGKMRYSHEIKHPEN